MVLPDVFVLVRPPVVPLVLVTVVPLLVPVIFDAVVPLAIAVEELVVTVLDVPADVEPPAAVVEPVVAPVAVMRPVVPVAVVVVPVVLEPDTELVAAVARLLVVPVATALAKLLVTEFASCVETTVAVPSGVMNVGLTALVVCALPVVTVT